MAGMRIIANQASGSATCDLRVQVRQGCAPKDPHRPRESLIGRRLWIARARPALSKPADQRRRQFRVDLPFVKSEISLSQDSLPTVVGTFVKKGLVTVLEGALGAGQQRSSIALHRLERGGFDQLRP